MTSFNFGKDITRKFYPLEDNEPINLYSQAPAIYLFSEQPSLTTARAGTGALQTISYWNDTTTIPYTRTYTIPAISDPNPTSVTSPVWFYEAINYYAKNGGQLQTKIRTIELEKGKANESAPDATARDIKDIYPAIINYIEDDTELENHLTSALSEIKRKIKAKGIKWGDIEGLKDLKYALAFLAIQYACEANIVEATDKFAIRAEIYSKKFNEAFSDITLIYDSNNDGIPDAEIKPTGILIGSR